MTRENDILIILNRSYLIVLREQGKMKSNSHRKREKNRNFLAQKDVG